MESVTHLLILAVSAGCVDVKGRGVEAADIGRAFTGRIDHVKLRKQGDVTQVTSVVHRSVMATASSANGRRRRLLMLQQLLTSELATGLQFGHESNFLRIPFGSPERIFSFAQFLLLTLEPRQSGHVIGHSTTIITTPMMISEILAFTSFSFLTFRKFGRPKESTPERREKKKKTRQPRSVLSLYDD
jgi:hypothetical protein